MLHISAQIYVLGVPLHCAAGDAANSALPWLFCDLTSDDGICSQIWSIVVGMPLCLVGGIFYSWASGQTVVNGFVNAYGALYKIPGTTSWDSDSPCMPCVDLMAKASCLVLMS